MTTKNNSRSGVTDAEMDALLRRAAEREKTATKIRSARYDARRDVVVVGLSTESTVEVPRARIAGFAKANSGALTDLAINPGAESLWSANVDDGVLLEQLIAIAFGENLVMTVGARFAARRRSPAGSAASRENGKKGGRPRKNIPVTRRKNTAA
jgi:hypothetical protein